MKRLRLTRSNHMMLVRHKSNLLCPNRAAITQTVNCRNNNPAQKRNNPELFPNCMAIPSLFSPLALHLSPLRLSVIETTVKLYVLIKHDFLFSFITSPKQLVSFSAVFHTKWFCLFVLCREQRAIKPQGRRSWVVTRHSTSSMIQSLPQPQEQAIKFHASVIFKSLCCQEQANVVKDTHFGIRQAWLCKFTNWGPLGKGHNCSESVYRIILKRGAVVINFIQGHSQRRNIVNVKSTTMKIHNTILGFKWQ